MQNNFDTFYLIGAILAASFGTAMTRLLPFFVFKNIANNNFLKYLQETMPLLIMTLLIFFSLLGTPWHETYGIYEISGIFAATLCFLWFKNSVFSIFIGIIFYIFTIRIF